MSECKVCQHPQRADIDKALRAAGGRGRNALARQYALAETTMGRHITLAHYQQPEERPMEPVHVPYPAEPEILNATGLPELLRALAPVQEELAAVQAALARLEEQGSARTQARDQQVEALQRQLKACKTELGEVRQIVAAIPLDQTVLPMRVAKLEARLASEGQRTQALEADLHQVRRALDGMTATVGRVAEFFAQLKLDANLWAACLNIARSGSQGTHSSALKEWLAKVAGRQLSDNDKVLQ